MTRSLSQGDLRWSCLHVLQQHEMTGCDVADWLAAHGIELAEGLVYAALRHLEREGLAAAHWIDVGEGSPRRRYYVLTPAGERSLAGRQARRVPAWNGQGVRS
jgi:PadR family transcriptional regulator PadR